MLSGKIATNYEPYNEIGAEILNERAKKVFQNKVLADKFKLMEIDRQIEKEEEASQDNIFPESKANKFIEFGKAAKENSANFHWDKIIQKYIKILN